MGWTSYYATHFKHGQIDRKAELREEFSSLSKDLIILKDSMVGTTWYAAIKNVATGAVWAEIVLTSVKGIEFYYKEMSEDMGPYQYKCPKSILELLSPTDSKFANNWRAKCWEKYKKEVCKNEK